MKKHFTTFIILLLAINPPILFAAQYKISKVLNGNTIALERNRIGIKIRLVGILEPGSPERKGKPGQQFGRLAKKHLADLVLKKKVSLKRYSTGSHNLMLAVVFQGTKNINLEMIKAGLAEVYLRNIPKGVNRVLYLQAENDAREAGKGIWSKEAKTNVRYKR